MWFHKVKNNMCKIILLPLTLKNELKLALNELFLCSYVLIMKFQSVSNIPTQCKEFLCISKSSILSFNCEAFPMLASAGFLTLASFRGPVRFSVSVHPSVKLHRTFFWQTDSK